MFEVTSFDGWKLVVKQVAASDVSMAIINSQFILNQILKIERIPELEN